MVSDDPKPFRVSKTTGARDHEKYKSSRILKIPEEASLSLLAMFGEVFDKGQFGVIKKVFSYKSSREMPWMFSGLSSRAMFGSLKRGTFGTVLGH